jgi:hypothetical protein
MSAFASSRIAVPDQQNGKELFQMTSRITPEVAAASTAIDIPLAN